MDSQKKAQKNENDAEIVEEVKETNENIEVEVSDEQKFIEKLNSDLEEQRKKA